LSAAEVLSRVREISDALNKAWNLVDDAARQAEALVNAFDASEGGVDMPRFEHAVYSLLVPLAHNLGVDLGDEIRGDFQLDSVTKDARELFDELTEIAAKGADDGR
jgi:hypothetical protein